jgi:sec-independent protein translocase protein TatA
MIGDLFDSPWKIAIIAVLIIVLFGARKMPEAARSLGKSMRILKAEVTKLHDDDEPVPGASAPASAQPAAPAQLAAAAPAPAPADLRDGQQGQIDALQQQIRDLQRAAAMKQDDF